MATNQITKSTPVQNYQSANLNKADKNPISKQGKNSAIDKKLPLIKNEPEIKPDSAKEKRNKEIEQYLKMISRFENKLIKDEIEEKELEKVFENLGKRVSEMTNGRKKRLINSEFFKKHEITNLNTMKDSLTELFQDDKKRVDGLDFLKSPEFITLIHNQTEPPQTYSPTSVKAKSMQSNQSESGVKQDVTPKSAQNPVIQKQA